VPKGLTAVLNQPGKPLELLTLPTRTPASFSSTWMTAVPSCLPSPAARAIW
jgi:hypothetical protein